MGFSHILKLGIEAGKKAYQETKQSLDVKEVPVENPVPTKAARWRLYDEKSLRGIFELKHWVIRKNKNGTARVHLHGERKRFLDKPEKHIDYVTLELLPGETDAELVRCAVAVSPYSWVVGSLNHSRFGGTFYKELDARLKATLPDPSMVSSSNSK